MQLKKDLNSAMKAGKKIKFKLEPCILHVSCRTLEDAKKIYDKAKLAGWKKSGIIGMKNGTSVELNGTDRLEFPVIRGNKVLVDDEFLKIIADESRKKLEKNWIKIKKLEGLINRKI
jgi:tRNA(Phe) wybutosine-synthesizing methylase Tyw3